jgi:hypothetical protein
LQRLSVAAILGNGRGAALHGDDKPIGQAFADELFRVFETAYPGVTLTPINVSIAVLQMASPARVGAAELL